MERSSFPITRLALVPEKIANIRLISPTFSNQALRYTFTELSSVFRRDSNREIENQAREDNFFTGNLQNFLEDSDF